MSRMCVLIITDDKRFERMLSFEFSSRGIDLVNGAEAIRAKGKGNQMLVVADLDFCASGDVADLAKNAKVIGFSRSYKNELGDVVKCCHAFLHRPFLIDELVSSAFDGGEMLKKRGNALSKMKEHRYLTVDEIERCAVYGNERIMLTDSEYRVLSLLCEKRGECVGRDDITGVLGASDSNNCDVYICMLRRKIDNRLGLKLITTVRGKGYMIPN